MATLITKGADKKGEATNGLPAQQFMDYFNEKVAVVCRRNAMSQSPNLSGTATTASAILGLHPGTSFHLTFVILP